MGMCLSFERSVSLEYGDFVLGIKMHGRKEDGT